LENTTMSKTKRITTPDGREMIDHVEPDSVKPRHTCLEYFRIDDLADALIAISNLLDRTVEDLDAAGDKLRSPAAVARATSVLLNQTIDGLLERLTVAQAAVATADPGAAKTVVDPGSHRTH
jgi:hypothetical protein